MEIMLIKIGDATQRGNHRQQSPMPSMLSNGARNLGFTKWRDCWNPML
jgi:hypothetical protein